MMTLGGSIKAGFSQETELNKKGRGGKKKREREFWAEVGGGILHIPEKLSVNICKMAARRHLKFLS